MHIKPLSQRKDSGQAIIEMVGSLSLSLIMVWLQFEYARVFLYRIAFHWIAFDATRAKSFGKKEISFHNPFRQKAKVICEPGKVSCAAMKRLPDLGLDRVYRPQVTERCTFSSSH